MNAQQMYLAWLRTYAPSIYSGAVRRATGHKRSLGGLADDLVNKSFSPDLSHSFLGDDTMTYTDESALQDAANASVDSSLTSIPAFDPSTVAAPNPVLIASGVATPTPAAPSSSTFSNILQAVTAIGAGVISASNQSKLIALNTQRAAQGLPPVNAAGQVVSGTGFATTSPALLAFERAISGGTSGSMLPLLLIGGGLIAAFAFLGKRS